MNFDFSDEQRLLQKTARDFLAERAPLGACRAVLESTATHDASLWKAIAELGWLGTAVPEAYGGAGFGALEAALLAEEVGRVLAPIPFASHLLATDAIVLAGSEEQKQRWLPRLVAGEIAGCFAGGARTSLRFANGRLEGTHTPVPDGGAAKLAVVVAQGERGPTLALVLLDASGARCEMLATLDPSRSAARLQFENTPAERLGEDGQGALLAARLLDRTAVTVAFEQLGGAARALDLTREFTLGRYAFGRPIASFQALQHRLADRWADLELARSNAYYGAYAAATNAPDLPAAASAARIAASHAFEAMATDMIQMHGGVGFTWEYDCHLFYRRAKWLALAFGAPAHWEDRLVAHVAGSTAQEAA